MKINFWTDPENDFWLRVDSSESPTRVYACTCPGAPVEHLGDCGTNGPGWMATRELMGCLAMRSDRTRCKTDAIEDAPFCDLHMEKLAKWVGRRYPQAFTRMLGDAEAEYVNAVVRAHRKIDFDDEANTLKSRVYFFGIDDRIVKIGRSVRPENRLAQVRQGSSLMPDGYDRKKVELLGSIPGGPALEAKLHAVLRPHRLEGEWFAQHPEVVAVMAYLLGGEMASEARRVFTDSLTRPWWINEGFLTEQDAAIEYGESA